MNLTLNPYTGLYVSDDLSLLFDPAAGVLYQYDGRSYVAVGTAAIDQGYGGSGGFAPGQPSGPAPSWPAPSWPAPSWPSPSGPGGWWPFPSTPQQPAPQQPQPPPRPSLPVGPTAPNPPVYAIPPKPGSVSPPKMPPLDPTTRPYVPAPAANIPAGTPVVRQGAPPPRQGGAKPAYVGGMPSGTGSGGTITGGPDPRQGYWEIIPNTDGYWAGSAHENLFVADNSYPVKKVRWDSGFMFEQKIEAVMRLKNPAPGFLPDFFLLYQNPTQYPHLGFWGNMMGIQVKPVAPF